MNWLIVVAIVMAVFVYINIGYLYAKLGLHLAQKNMVAKQYIGALYPEARRVKVTFADDWYMVIVCPFTKIMSFVRPALKWLINYPNYESEYDGILTSDDVLLDSIQIPAIAANNFAQNRCKAYMSTMAFVWPLKVFIALITFISAIGMIVGASFYFFIKNSWRTIVSLLTWPQRRIKCSRS